jgi:RNA polymerase sigma-70 factor, ECF subfamily
VRSKRHAPRRPGPLDRESAFERLFHPRTLTAVGSWLEHLGVPRQDRGDLTQEVFLAACRSFASYEVDRARPERWLNGITVRVAARYHERARRRRDEVTPEDLAVELTDERPGPEERLAAEEERRLALTLLDAADAGPRAVLVAHDLDELPMAEIAARRGLPLSTTYRWRARALEALRAATTQGSVPPVPSSRRRRGRRKN